MAESGATFRALVTAFTDFLTVAIHTILYERSIYPQTSFLSAKKYNYPVRQNRHPKVCEWINDAVVAVDAELLKGGVERVAVVIFTKEDVPLERFVFDVSQFPTVPSDDLDTLLERSGSDGEPEAILPLVDMEEQFRATMSKLSNCGTTLKPVPERCTFTVAIELKKEGQAPVSHPQPWIPAQRDAHGTLPDGSITKSYSHRTTSMRSVRAGDMRFEAWRIVGELLLMVDET
jgi:mitotic spindle assembly checkpoint protein MAD2B